MIARRLAVTATVTAAALVLGGCGVVGSVRDRLNPPTPAYTPQSAPSGRADLAPYYSQRLAWSSCSGGDCASLKVPLDYADPSGATISIAVFKAPATRPSQRIGSLVVNPGGPGGSGVDYARAADYIVAPDVRERFDIVGFDPRGVDRSDPIQCVSPSQLDTFLGTDPTPDTPAEEQGFAAQSKLFADACAANAGPLLAHVSTEDAARDMVVLRAALGEDRLNYLGKSYGTFLGATYAGLFPTKVGRFVLDGVLPPDLTADQIDLGQAQGFELATRTWAAYCVNKGSCPLGSTVDQVMQGLRDFLAQVDATPIAKTGDSAVTKLTEGWASTGIAAAMYDQGSWPTLVTAMRQALAGDGTGLMNLANLYADRKHNGGYVDNLMQVIYAVNCLDRPESGSLAQHEALAAEAEKTAPTWGSFLMWSALPCGYWPVPATGKPETISAQGSGPIVVIGTTRDPATPYAWAVRLRDQLANASLITFNGDGHTAYMRSNSCVDDAVDAYYIAGTVPKDGLHC